MQEMTKAEAKEKLKSFEKAVVIKTLDGEKRYSFVLLKRKDAARVFHNTLLVIAGAFAELVNTGEDTKPEDILKALRTLDFDTIWNLAETLLANVIVDGTEIDLDDYYGEHPSELYLAVWNAVQINYPKVFIKIREKLTGSILADQVADLIQK